MTVPAFNFPAVRAIYRKAHLWDREGLVFAFGNHELADEDRGLKDFVVTADFLPFDRDFAAARLAAEPLDDFGEEHAFVGEISVLLSPALLVGIKHHGEVEHHAANEQQDDEPYKTRHAASRS